MNSTQEAVVVSVYDRDEEEEDRNDYEFKVGCSVCSVNITNRDLGPIVNGHPGDLVEKGPFDKCFATVKSTNTWIMVGFVLMTHNAALNLKV